MEADLSRVYVLGDGHSWRKPTRDEMPLVCWWCFLSGKTPPAAIHPALEV
jgi:hypothetical protein